jgi:thiosulfate/3-mercaptopyruvate sulfurtransferase
MIERIEPLVSTEWLAARLGAPDIRIVDASWHFPQTGRVARTEYEEAHIPGAVFFDIDEIADTSSPYPHMLPDPAKFASRMKKLGLGDGNRMVIYDTLGLFSAARVWWMFRVMGHEDVAVLDGGLPKWRAEGRPVDDTPPVPRERHFTPRPNRTLVRDVNQMMSNLGHGAEQVVDARGRPRFLAQEPEPRPGVRGGHIPGSANVPYSSLLRDDGTMKSEEELRQEFARVGIDIEKPIIASCGSGVTAGIIVLALTQLGSRDVALYDGSWSEWGSRHDLPIET